MPAFRCRVEDDADPSVDCGEPAAVGIITEADENGTALEMLPVCADHAPEEVHEVAVSMHPSEWAVVSLAYGSSDGGLT